MTSDDGFDAIIQPLVEKPERVALVLFFDKLQGSTQDDFLQLVTETHEFNVGNPAFVNLNVDCAWGNVADEIKAIFDKHLPGEFETPQG